MGAHNQRSIIRLCLRYPEILLDRGRDPPPRGIGKRGGLLPLKRPDEKYVTDKAYERPMFVEDVVRTVAEKAQRIENFTWYCVEAENIESIHNHSAYARIEKGR